MSRKFRLKSIAAVVAAGSIVATMATPVAQASPLAGAFASMYSINEAVFEDASPLSGSTLALSNILVKANKGMLEASVQVPIDEPAAPASEFVSTAICIASDFVNVRSAADSESEIVGKLYNNGVAEVRAIENGWVLIHSGSVDGYVDGGYVSINNPELCESVSRVVARINNADMLNIREQMSVDSRVVGRAANGAGLTILDRSMMPEGWVMVDTGAGPGYVAAEFVTIEREYQSCAESREEEAARLAYEAAVAEAEARAAAERANRPQGGGSSYTPAPAQNRTYNPPSGGTGSDVVNFAMQFVGNPYVYGGSSLTNGTDCSGFVMSVYSNFGVGLPHSSRSLRNVGVGVSGDDIQPGDIVCYNGHVGIYAGGGNIVHASNAREGIKVSSAYYTNILAIRRIF